MKALRTRLIRHLSWVLLGLATLGVLAGLVRLLPWLVAENVPLRVALPFVRALAAVTTETAWLIGAPLAAGTAMAAAADMGERQALAALGVRPARVAVTAAPVVAGACLVSILLAVMWGEDARHPGRFAQDLVDQGRQACATVKQPRALAVPMLKLTWICFPDRPPRVVGRVPGQKKAWLSASRVTFDDRVATIRAEHLAVATPRSGSVPAIAVKANRATIRGLPALGSGSPLRTLPRALVVGAASAGAFFVALLATWTLRIRHQLAAVGLAAGGPVAALGCLHALDRAGAGSLLYAGVPLAAVCVSAALYAAAWAGRRAGRRAWRK